MDPRRLEQILGRFQQIRVLVLGDFFLDEYLVIDPALAEVSLETGLEAHQVVDVRTSPGAAGTVVSNLTALGVGKVAALGIIGTDGNGYTLLDELNRMGVRTELLVRSADRFTPTYTKPMRRAPDGAEAEMQRIDVKNRTRTSRELEEMVIKNLRAALPEADAVIIGDQVQEEDCGTVTAAVRYEAAALAEMYSTSFFFADSRCHIGKFRNMMIKPNQREAAEASGCRNQPLELVLKTLWEGCKRPVFLTRGADGIAAFDGDKIWLAPAPPVTGPIDIVGAGDSATAGIVCALCAGATVHEAAQVGNLVASVTIRKLGTTGTASPEEVREANRR